MQRHIIGKVESLESRTMLAGNVTAVLADGVLTVTGDDANNSVVVTQKLERVANQGRVVGGSTSIDLDTALLESAAGLKLSGVRSPLRPRTGFDATFPILPTSDFVFKTDSFAPVSGVIKHAGTVSFNNGATTVGNFEIGYDAARADAATGKTGFYVKDTKGTLGILFDVATPDATTVDRLRLNITGADLLVSPELAGALQKPAIAGTDVGNAQVNAIAAPVYDTVLVVDGLSRLDADTTVNGSADPATFDPDDVTDVVVNLGAGNDRAGLALLKVEGDVSVNAGAGDDTVVLASSSVGGDLSVLLGEGNDHLNVLGSRVVGKATLNGEAGRDSLVALFARFGSSEISNFESRFPWSRERIA